MTIESSPYSAPNVDVINESDDASALSDSPNSCDAGSGLAWIKEGFGIFKNNAGLWIAMMIVYMVLFIGISIIPIIGSIGAIILGPLFTGGLMVAARNSENGSMEFGDLFAGFKDHFGSLAAVGFIYFGLVLIPMIVMFGVGFGGLLGGDMATEGPDMASMTPFFVAGGVFMIILLPVMMGLIFSPPLIIFHDMGAWSAYKKSMGAFMKNILPFIVFFIISMVLGILALIPFGLGFLVVSPLIFCAMYCAYKAIFLK